MAISNSGERKLAALRSILVATDFSPQENAAFHRASQLARLHGASLKFVYLPLKGQEASAHADLLAAARRVDLVVLPHRRRSTAAFFRGEPVLRLLRRSGCPVLVVRQAAAAPYERILVAVDFTDASRALVAHAASFGAAARLELFHAVGTREEAMLRSAEASEPAVRAYRARRIAHAQRGMLALTHAVHPRPVVLSTFIARGDPGRQVVVRQEQSGADLVVVGKHPGSAWGDFLCGSVAHRVLSWGSSDVLVMPTAFVGATAPMAARRMRAARGHAAFAMPAGSAS
jgi:nucleotide-binding universal stress UspA family protein